MVKGKFLTPQDPELQDCFEIRKKVFIDEQQIDPDLEYDEWDRFAKFAAVCEGDKIVGTGRIIFDGETYKIGRIAVLKEVRGRGYGDFIVRMMIDNAFSNGAKEVHIDAQKHALGFYEKIGFKVCGDEHLDAGIPHFPMVITRADFSTPCGHCKAGDYHK